MAPKQRVYNTEQLTLDSDMTNDVVEQRTGDRSWLVVWSVGWSKRVVNGKSVDMRCGFM